MADEEKRPRGRPRQPDTTVVNLRIPRALLDRLDRYLDHEAQFRWPGNDIQNRATFTREAIQKLLEEKGY